MLEDTPTALDVIERYRPYIELPRHGRAVAVRYFTLALVVFVTALIASAFLRELDPVVAFGVFPLLLGMSGACVVAGRRALLPDIISVLRRDSRRPVLYLRTFNHDEIPNTKSEWLSLLGDAVTPLQLLKKIRWTAGMEACVCDVLRTVGPVIAVARPDEIWNLSTAHRLKLDDSHWQAVVGQLMNASSLIVADVSGSSGLRWEIEQAATTANRGKLVMAFATGRTKKRRSAYAYNHVCDLVNDVFGYRLPDLQGNICFVTVGSDGVPAEHRMTTTRSFSRLIFGRFRLTLFEVLRGMGNRSRLSFRWGVARVGAAVASVILIVGAYAVNGLIEGTQRARDQRISQLREFSRRDQEWRAELKGAIEGLNSQRYSVDRTVQLIHTKVIARLRDEQAALTNPPRLTTSQNDFLRRELNQQVTAHIDALQQLAAALKDDDPAGARSAIESERRADQILNDFLRTHFQKQR